MLAVKEKVRMIKRLKADIVDIRKVEGEGVVEGQVKRRRFDFR